MPKSRQQSNQRAKWGAPVSRSNAKGKRVNVSPRVPARVVSKEVARDAQVLVNHLREIIKQGNPHLNMVQINYMIAQQLGIIKKR